ncbi:MAG TPA: hypothetical protein VGI33_19670 [Paenibacillus sp.]|jgi:hypothetical protein
MSYDLMVFETTSAPKDKKSFMKWYEQQTEWAEEHSYNDPSVSSEALRNWFFDMKESFPQMNGPYAPSDDILDALEEAEDHRVSDYSMGRDIIYICFAWSCADDAYKTVRNLAQKHRVGFFDVSGNGEIIL